MDGLTKPLLDRHRPTQQITSHRTGRLVSYKLYLEVRADHLFQFHGPSGRDPVMNVSGGEKVLNIWPLATKYDSQCNRATRARVLKSPLQNKNLRKTNSFSRFFSSAREHADASDGW